MIFLKNRNFKPFAIGVFWACFVSYTAHAQVEPSMYSYGMGKGEYIKIVPRNDKSDEIIAYHDSDKISKKDYIYEELSLASLSHLYWAVSLLDIENNEHVDNFLKINECEIYKNYFGSEFEWKEIREAGREFIRKNKDQFPLRFKIVQPLLLRDYDMKRKAFLIDEEFQIMSVRRFEAYAHDANFKACNDKSIKELVGYSRGIVLELSRPFSMSYVPVKPKDAVAYIQDKEALLKKLPDGAQTEANRYRFRKAYIVFRVKVFAHRKTVKIQRKTLTQMMAALEGFEIYGDINLKKVLFAKNYLDQQGNVQTSEELAAEYEVLREKSKGDGVLY